MARGRRGGREGSERTKLPRGFGVIWTTVAIDLVGFGVVLPILPQYAERFGVGAALIGVLSASFSLAQLIFAPVWGRLSDRFGRKPILLVSLFGTALGSLLTGVAGSIWILFVGRILDGISGASVSVAQAAVGDVSPPSQRARLMGLLGAAFGVGFVVGPAIGALAALGGPHVPFFIAAAIAAVNGLVAIKRLPETAKGVAGHPLADPEVVAARTAEFAAFEAAAAGTAAAGTAAAGSRSAADDAVAAALDAERIAAEPALDGPGIVEPAHLARPSAAGAGGGADDGLDRSDVDRSAIVRLIVVAFVAMVAFAGFEATFSLLAQERFGLALASTSAVFAAIGIVLVAVQGGLVHPVTSRLGERGTLRFGLVSNALGLGLLAISLGWPGLIVALLLLTVGQGLLTPTLSSAVAGRAGRQRGAWLGWQQSAGGLARVIGPIVAGSLFEFTGVGAPYVLGAVLALVALVLIPTGPAPADRAVVPSAH
jgi:DHA1 family tetracycline resistance protein-like MFS transporter